MVRKRRVGTWLVAVAGAVLWVGLMPKAGAVTGPHNMSNKTPNGEVCVTCHAPHKVPNSPLLWNHVLSSSNFSWSDWTQTTGGTPLPANLKTWSGSSKLCLGCHDGTVDLGAIINPATDFDTNKINADAKIGPDLKGNHPIGIPYPYNGAKNTYNGLTTGGEALASGWKATPTKVKLYYDPTQPAPSNRGIECASCHDPHELGAGGADSYLRDTVSGSAICLDCHTK